MGSETFYYGWDLVEAERRSLNLADEFLVSPIVRIALSGRGMCRYSLELI